MCVYVILVNAHLCTLIDNFSAHDLDKFKTRRPFTFK